MEGSGLEGARDLFWDGGFDEAQSSRNRQI